MTTTLELNRRADIVSAEETTERLADYDAKAVSGTKLPSAWAKFNWSAPFVSLVYVLYLLIRDAILVVGLMVLSHGVEALLDKIDGAWAPVVYGYTVTSAKVVSSGDHGLLIVFLLLQFSNVVRVMVRDGH
jgi:hypothetical protein